MFVRKDEEQKQDDTEPDGDRGGSSKQYACDYGQWLHVDAESAKRKSAKQSLDTDGLAF